MRLDLQMAIADDLASAKAALHALLTGKAVAQVRDSDGSFVSYTKTNIADLRAYIADLESQLPDATPRRGPLRIFF